MVKSSLAADYEKRVFLFHHSVNKQTSIYCTQFDGWMVH